ncbi:ROK family protein [Streptomyces fulvissimus]|uniref:ROK family protein n=1 Tax=Streptomyces microflavus TaxID=1919 RepID=A0A6N9VKT6_STRMI|nr:ROK family protein [Streptomyces microflavus]
MDTPAELSVPHRAATHGSHVVIDIGGTWFRSARRGPSGELTNLSRQYAINYLNHPHLTPTRLRQRLVDYIIQQTRRLERPDSDGSPRVSISMGAAVNGHNGIILNAGPLWGPESEPFDLRGALNRVRSDVEWSIVNDVTALAMHFACKPQYRGLKKISVLTLSTGIALRTIEVAELRVPIHPRRGIQGEIGHIAIDFSAGRTALELRCDCGGHSHLNAYCSGRGIPQVMASLAAALGEKEWRSPELLQDPSLWAKSLKQGLADHTSSAELLLDSVVRPIAQSIVSLLSIDPEIGRIIVTGGVVRSLGRPYEIALLRNLDRLGLYMLSEDDPDHLAGMIDFADSDDEAGLHGAAIAADLVETSRPHGESSVLSLSLRSHHARRMAERVEVSYDVKITTSSAGKELADTLVAMESGAQPLLLADANVSRIYGQSLVQELEAAGFRPLLKNVTAGELSKNWETLENILRVFESTGVSRNQHPIVALGGGAVLDSVGLAAGLYRRGVPYVRVPTSLVGLIDASVGAKVAINLFGHKNRVGLFYTPNSVILDAAFLRTLPPRFMISGLAEMIKIAVVAETELFGLMELHSACLTDPSFYRTEPGLGLLARAADAMMSSLEGNLWESNLERSVDFGHSLTQVLETVCPPMTHGEAVAVDMALSLEIGRARRITASHLADRIIRMIRAIGLPVHSPNVSVDQLMGALMEAASHRGGWQRLPLIRGIGEPPVFVSDIKRGELTEAWARLELEGRRL